MKNSMYSQNIFSKGVLPFLMVIFTHKGSRNSFLVRWGMIIFISSVASQLNAQVNQRGTATTSTTGTSTLTINKPTGVVTGDVLIAVISLYNTTSTTITAPSDWTLIDKRILNAASRYGAVFYKVATSSEGSSYSFTLSSSGTNYSAGSIIAFYNVNSSSTFDAGFNTILTASSATVSATTITTSTDNSAVVMLGMGASYNGTPTWSGWNTATSPGTLTEKAERSRTYATVGIAWATKTSVGSTGTGTATLSNSQRNGGLLIALKYAPTQFRSKINGDWNTASTWEQSTDGGNSWSDATTYPTSSNNSSTTIQSGHTISLTANATASNLIINGVLNLVSYDFTVTGTTTIGGTLNFNGWNTARVFTGLVTINSDGIWDNTFSSTPVTFRGGITNNGTFRPGSAYRYTFDTNAQSLNGTLDFSSSSLIITGVNVTNYGTLTLSSNLNGTGTLTNASSSTLNLSGSFYTDISYINNQGTIEYTSAYGVNTATANFTNTGTINLNSSASIAGITNNTGGLINISNLSYNINSLVATAIGNTINYNGTGDQTVKNTTYYNLTISGGGTKTLGGATTVSGVLALSDGVLATTSSNLLSVTNTATSAITGGSSASYIDGPIKRSLPASLVSGSTYTFPVGDGGLYKPFSLINPTTGTGTITVQVEAFAENSGGTVDATLESISTDDYWQLTKSGNLTNTSVSLGRSTAILPLNTIAASTTQGGTYTLINGTVGVNDVTNSSTVTIGSNLSWYFALGRIKPKINISTTSISGFTYAENNGPSTEQSFTVSGTNLSENIKLSLPVNSKYELSTTSGGTFTGSVNALLNNDGSGTVPPTTIYMRLKIGLTVGTYNDVCTASSLGADNKTVSIAGSVTNQPLINVTPSSLTGLSYVLGNGPSAAQSFVVTGSNLQSDIAVVAPTNFEIATSSSGTYYPSLSLTQSLGSVNTTVWARLKTGLSTSIYNEDITLSASYAFTKIVNCQGAVNRATINVSQFTLAGFIYTLNAGPSDIQSFSVSGTTLSANVVLTAPTHFEISTSLGGTYGSSISLAPTSGTTLNSTPIYVKMKSGYSVGVISAENITLTTTNAITQLVACSGAVVNIASTISSSPTLNGFFYIVGQGPSIKQSFNISATSLTSNVTVTAPVDFEISSSGTEGTFGTTLSINQTSGKVNASPVYIRLKIGLPIGTYNETLTISSNGATTVNVACNGKVVAQPTIIAGPSNPLLACDGSSVTLTSTGTNIINQTWSGPNNFYSSEPNPSLGTVNSTKSGNYTVTGNIGSGVNLLTNGDFELGNSGFGSTYTYTTPPTTGYGLYYVVSNPNNANTTYFISGADHTSGTGTLQMVVDGAETTGAIIWSQTIAVNPNTAYQFSYWAENVNSQGNNNYAKLQLFVNNVPIGTINTISATSWNQYLCDLNSGSSTSLQLTMINTYIGGSGNDFALDDLNFEQVIQVSNTLPLTVNPIVTPSVTISASSNPATSGATVTFTATPTNGGASPTYAWYVGTTLQVGVTGSTFSYVPTNGDQVKCILTSNLSCTTVNPVNSTNTITMVVNPATNFWRGTNSTDWGTASNWTGGYIPIAGADVVFATVANYGDDAINDLALDQNRTQGSLINQTTKNLIIPAGKTLTINNTITTDGNVSRIHILSSSTVPTGSLIFYTSNPVYGTVEMWSQSSWDTSRPANQKYNWQFFGIPIDTVKASPTVDGAYIRFRDEAGNDTTTHWHSLTNTSNIIPFYGYELCYQTPRLLAFRGKLVNRNFNSGQLAKTTTGGVLYGGQHIFANPYTAAIDIRQIDFGNDMEQTIYFYNTGTFAQWNAGTAGKIGSTPGQYTAATKQLAGTSQIPRQIPSMSSMLVRVINSTSNSYLRINYNTVTMTNSELQRAPSENGISTDFVCTRIDVESKSAIDKMWLFADDQLSRTYDNGYDAKKMTGSALNQQIYAVEEDGNYQINAVNDFNNTSIAFQAGQDTTYKMTFANENIDKKYTKLYLYDIQENKVVDVTENGSTYEFTAQSTPKPILRFKIITKSDSTTTDGTSSIVYFNINNTLYLYNQGQEICKVYVYDISGRNVGQRSIAASGNANISLTPQHTYILKMVSSTSNESKKIMIQ